MPKKELFKDTDKFLEWYKSKRPETIYLIKNKQRYDEAMAAVSDICKYSLKSNPEETRITANPDELLGTSICVEIISTLIVFEDIENFCAALSKANNFEVCARVDGKFLLGIVFEDVYEIAPHIPRS